MSHKNNTLIGLIIGGVVIAAVFFFIGDKVGTSHASSSKPGQFAGMMGTRGGAGGMRARAGGFANGTILSMTDSSITITLQNGGSQTIYFTPTTPVLKSVAGAPTDLKAGEMITATGTPNADGSIAATNVTIRPTPPSTPAQ